jgi:hypothetical protein
VAVLDLERRITVISAVDDGLDSFPHVLRGVLAAQFAEPTWHVVVAFADDKAQPPAVREVLAQASRWAAEHACRFTVTNLGDVAQLTRFEA